MKENNSKAKITTSDLHLKNIFLNDYYLELGNIDIDVMNKILKYQVVPINEITYYPIQNKGIGTFCSENKKLKKELPYMFFKKVSDTDKSRQLLLTYGLLECYKPNFKDRFMPVFLLPLELYYYNNEFLVQLISKPFENPLIHTIFGDQSKLNFSQNKNLNDLFILDQSLHVLSKMTGCNVKLENYLTFASRKKRHVFENDNIFKQVKMNNKYYQTKTFGDDNYYMSIAYSKQQREFLEKAMQKDNLTLSGRDGTGKTTVLKDIAINAINKGKRVLYISNKNETIKNVSKTFEEIGLKNIVADLTIPFTALNNYDNKFETIESISLTEDINTLKEKYKMIDEYERLMGGRIADYLFKEILEQLSVLADIDHSNSKLLNEEDLIKLDYVHKNEFIQIKSALEKIQTNLYKANGFKSSVWKEIPVFNTIKYANQVLSLIKNINDGYSDLFKKRKELNDDYGITVIKNYASFRKSVQTIEKLDTIHIPKKWQHNYDIFKQASDMYNNLKRDLSVFKENEYLLNTNYIDPFNIDIEKEISLILDNRFTLDDKEIIDNIFADSLELKSIVEQTLFDLKEYSDKKQILIKELGWDFFKTDEDILELIKFTDMLNDNVITIRVSNALIENKISETINRSTKIKEHYKNISAELNDLVSLYPNIANENLREFKRCVLEEPRKARAIRKKYGKITNAELINLCEKYLELTKTIKKVEDEYYVNTGFKIDDGLDVVNVFNILGSYYNEIKGKPFLFALKEFLDGYDSRTKNNKKEYILKTLNAFKKVYNSLNESFNIYSNYKLLKKELEFVSKISVINTIVDYLNIVFRSNNRVMNKIKNHETYYIKISDYLEYESILEKYKKSLGVLKNNDVYENIYSDLYDEEKTDIEKVEKIIKIYSEYGSLFENPNYLITSFKKLYKIKNLSHESEKILDEINETLKIYTRFFKDGVSRYYYNEFESILGYLDTLLNSKEDLICYLNITSGLAVLNKFGLNGLIDYISSIDKCDNIVNDFEYIFFSRLKDKYLADKKVDISDKDFIKLLKDTVDLEEKIRVNNNRTIVKNICENVIKKAHNHEVLNYNYKKYISKNTIKSLVLANTYHLDEGVNINKFDLIIVDDAEVLNSMDSLSILRNGQVIIAGSYIIHKAFSNSLLSVYFNEKTTIFKERFIPTPKKLLDKILKINGVIKNEVHKNNGVEVICDNIEEYIYSLYNENHDVLINYFIKDVEKQKKMMESIANVFLKNGIEDSEILEFLNCNLSIVDLLSGHLNGSDYNILDLSEYKYIDSEIEAANAFDHILLTKEKLIVYDKHNDLSSDNNLLFYNSVKKLTIQKSDDKLFNYDIIDENLAIIISLLKEKGYSVYPAKGICDLLIVNGEKFTYVNILFSNNSYSEVLNNFRSSYSEYVRRGLDVIYINLMSCSKGLSYIVNIIEKKVIKTIKKGNE